MLTTKFISFFQMYVFLYPLAMSVVWMIGGLFFWSKKEKGNSGSFSFRQVNQVQPPVTILVPCYNEAKTIQGTCEALKYLDYPDYRVVFIDDGSKDETVELLRPFIEKIPYYYLIRLSINQGKAQALNHALAHVVTTPLVVVIDADTHLEKSALKEIVLPFLKQPRLGAVTANAIPRNRTGFLANFQAAEFSSIVGLIKRSQRALGRILTVSGCATAYRTDILRRIGGFSAHTATEDIDITWKIQKEYYEVWFAPQALAYIQVPTNFKDLWKQRKRWSLGGWHLLRTHWDIFGSWKYRRLWQVYLDFVFGVIWAFCFVLGSLSWLLGNPFGFSPIPAWNGAVVSVVCLAQMGISLFINRKYDKTLWKSFFWVPWYPLLFYAIMTVAVVYTCPQGLFRKLDASAGKWQSPTRLSDKGNLPINM